MNKLLSYTFVPCLVLLAGCIKDDRNNFMVPDSITLTAAGTVAEASCHEGVFTFGVAKSGKGMTAARATVTPDGAVALLDAYNQSQKNLDSQFVDWESIPSDKFTLEGNEIEWAAADFVKEVKVRWDPNVMAAHIGDRKNCVIALTVQSSELAVNPSKKLILVQMSRSSVTLVQQEIARVVESSKVEPGSSGKQPVLTETLIFDLAMDNAVKHVDINFPITVDNSLIAEFNASQSETYYAAPSGLFTLKDDHATIAAASKSASFQGVIDKSILLENGKLKEFPNYVIPVRLDDAGMTASRNGEPFDLQALSYGNKVCYITVKYKQSHTGQLSISREWGRYSTADAAWNAYFGGHEDTDRNVALDDEYIYIAETGNADAGNPLKNVWAISRENPSVVTPLPVGTVKENGTFYVCCPRVIPNTDPAINGGKDVLCVANMSQAGDSDTNPPTNWLYVYDKGIAENPTPVGLKTWASRRLGDTFTWWGTFQNGMLFFKDANSAQGTVTFKLGGRLDVNLQLQGRIVAPAVTGAGSYFPFPDNVQKGIAATRGNKSWLVEISPDILSLAGATTPTTKELSGYYEDAAFKFFEYGDRRYIAYTRQVSSSDGRLIIIDGGKTESWETILNNRNIVYQAAIQEEAEMKDSYNSSPRGSTNSGMDLDVRAIDGDIYIAVVKQNVGLSLFRVTQ